jgi:hypothetical protein
MIFAFTSRIPRCDRPDVTRAAVACQEFSLALPDNPVNHYDFAYVKSEYFVSFCPSEHADGRCID